MLRTPQKIEQKYADNRENTHTTHKSYTHTSFYSNKYMHAPNIVVARADDAVPPTTTTLRAHASTHTGCYVCVCVFDRRRDYTERERERERLPLAAGCRPRSRRLADSQLLSPPLRALVRAPPPPTPRAAADALRAQVASARASAQKRFATISPARQRLSVSFGFRRPFGLHTQPVSSSARSRCPLT